MRIDLGSKNRILMPSRRKYSLKNLPVQLSLLVIGVPTLVLVVFGIYSIQTQTVSLEKSLNISLTNESVQLSVSLSTPLYNFDDETSKTICMAALKKSEIIKIIIYDFERDYLSFQDEEYSALNLEDGTKTIECPVFFKEEKIGKIEIIATTQFLKEKIERLKITSILQVVILDLFLGLTLIFVLILRFVKPLQELQQSSERIASGNLDQPINVQRNDELGALAENLITMRDAVKEKVSSLQSEVDQHQKTTIALEKSESFLRLIIDLIPHMIFVKDEEGRFLVVNKAVSDDLNSTVEAITGKLLTDVMDDPDRAVQMLADDQRVIKSKKTLSLLTESYSASQEASKWYSTKKVPFKATDGDSGIVEITIDITDLKQAEEELKMAKNYIDNIINSMPSALFSLDREFKITQWNHKAEKLYGIKAAQAISKTLDTVLPKMEPFMEDISKTIQTADPFYFQKQGTKTSEGLIYEDITVYPLIADNVEGAVIRVDDITEHVRMEEMVVQSEKMLSIGGLAAGMAHEINNPLAGMMQNAQVALRRVQGELSASVSAAHEVGITMEQIRTFLKNRGIIRQLELIHEAGVRAAQIVRNMLSFSRKDFSGKVRQDIAVILDQTIELARSDYDLKKQYDFKKIKIIREYHPETPQVLCEVTKIQQVFFNILKNCAEAMQELQTLKEPIFYIRVKQKGDFVRVEIEDNGPGMIQDVRKRIFEPFFTTKPVGKGTGLGLSVSYFIITDNHNGEMNIISEPGKGAKFVIHLPIM
ncbi:MAG: PAS domain S-box protein [Desulfobacteraceae bacterium]|nr:PAS domain S-box protein [Desulfobacteraceae bacterium]